MWPERPADSVEHDAGRFNYQQRVGRRGAGRPHKKPDQVRVLLGSHPLWTAEFLTYQQAVTAARQDFPKAQIEPIHPVLPIRLPVQYA
jgi:hypothetical protein